MFPITYVYKQHNLSEPNLTYSVLAFNFVKLKYNLHDPAALSNNLFKIKC